MKSLAAVLPRYGNSLGGGAETLVKALVEHLAGTEIPRVEVWTTCALDHRTWENVLPQGESVEQGIRVWRYPTDERDLETFISAEQRIQEWHPLSLDDQLNWLRSSVNSRGLYEHIARHADEFDAVLFAPYLFPTSFWGALMVPEKAILLPCLHDEHYAYQPVFRHLFSKVRGLIFNSEPEAELAAQVISLEGLEQKSGVVGMGFDDPETMPEPPGTVSEQVRELISSQKYLLYSGRKEQGKNLDLLLDAFSLYAQRNPASGVKLVLVGSGDLSFRSSLPAGILDLGFVSEAEKALLMGSALALVQPSVNESFSIVLMEAWLRRAPVVVHGRCAVTRDHVVRSGGGLFFTDHEEFCRVVDLLLETEGFTEGFRQKLGEFGRAYVLTEYSWRAVLRRWNEAAQKIGFQVNGQSHIKGVA